MSSTRRGQRDLNKSECCGIRERGDSKPMKLDAGPDRMAIARGRGKNGKQPPEQNQADRCGIANTAAGLAASMTDPLLPDRRLCNFLLFCKPSVPEWLQKRRCARMPAPAGRPAVAIGVTNLQRR